MSKKTIEKPKLPAREVGGHEQPGVLIREVGEGVYCLDVHNGDPEAPIYCSELKFQSGTVAEQGRNGVTLEALLAVVIDRLAQHQSTRFSCLENARALDLSKRALAQLHERTRVRRELGIEGTLKTVGDVEADKRQALEDWSARLAEAQKAVGDGRRLTREQWQMLDGASRNGALSLERRNTIQSVMTQAGANGLLPAEEE